MDLVLRAAVVYVFIFFITRVVGRRELNTLEPFDLILLVVTGDLVQQGVTQDDYSVTGAFLVIGTIALLTVGFAWAGFRSRRVGRLLEGEPIVLVENGNVIERNLRRERLTVREIESEARQQQIADLGSVKWAVLETSGKISFIPKSSS
jgi:uncharacterized membrane protein YcaP (DUF421 family)